METASSAATTVRPGGEGERRRRALPRNPIESTGVSAPLGGNDGSLSQSLPLLLPPPPRSALHQREQARGEVYAGPPRRVRPGQTSNDVLIWHRSILFYRLNLEFLYQNLNHRPAPAAGPHGAYAAASSCMRRSCAALLLHVHSSSCYLYSCCMRMQAEQAAACLTTMSSALTT